MEHSRMRPVNLVILALTLGAMMVLWGLGDWWRLLTMLGGFPLGMVAAKADERDAMHRDIDSGLLKRVSVWRSE